MPINVSEAICPDTSETIKVFRPGQQQIVDGIRQEPEYTYFPALASAQQPTFKEVLTLEEGDRDKNIWCFISNQPIRHADDRRGHEADIIEHKSKHFRVIFSGDWESYGYTEVIAIEERFNETLSTNTRLEFPKVAA